MGRRRERERYGGYSSQYGSSGSTWKGGDRYYGGEEWDAAQDYDRYGEEYQKHGRNKKSSTEKAARQEPAHREKLQFNDADTAFILGRGGKTKHKIARVSGARIELYERNNTVEISGSKEACEKAKKYISLVQAQRVGPVHVEDSDDGDLTMMDVPNGCVGFVTGSGGNFLRTCEEEWGTLMFFCDYQSPNQGSDRQAAVERLAIFGAPAGRAGAELKVMAAIEAKVPGHYTAGVGDASSEEEGWGIDTMILSGDELSFALGKEGSTRRKLAKASGCILEYIGNVAYMAGAKPERQRARDYMTWLKKQRTGPVFIDITGRSDATEVKVPRELTGILKGSALRDIEQETDTFCFLEGDVDLSDRLLIFGGARGRRHAERKVRELIRARPPRQPPMDGWYGQQYTKGGNKNGHGAYGYGDTENGQQMIKAEIRTGFAVTQVMDPERLKQIQSACGARLTQQANDHVLIEGYSAQVNLTKKHLQEYIFGLKVEEEFSAPEGIPFHIFIAKAGDGAPSLLEEVRSRTRVLVKVNQPEKKIILGGIFSVVANARRDLQAFLSSFVTYKVHLQKSQLEKVSVLCKQRFNKLNNFRHLTQAQIHKESLTMTLSGSPEAAAEAREVVDVFFKEQGWESAKVDMFAQKHSMSRSHGSKNKEGENAPGSPAAEGKASSRSGGKAAEILKLTDMDSAFILGRGGKTKHKIARVSGANLELHEHNCTVEIFGTELERKRARKYIDLVRAQRAGPVNVTHEEHDDGDLATIPVPCNCVGFVTGSQGNFLRTCEEEWGTLMFFCDYHGPGSDSSTETENLAIFGGRAGRTGAMLKVMAAIEAKIPYYYTRDVRDSCSQEEWGQDTLPLGNEELSFALGKDGSTRKKLAKASGCILEYIGNVAYMAGSLSARKRARDYLSWLMKQRTGTVYVDIENRNDVTVVDVPNGLEAVASVFKSMTLRGIEQETKTFCFLEGNANKSERLLIFGHDKAGREKAKSIALSKIDAKYRNQDDGWGGQGYHSWAASHKGERGFTAGGDSSETTDNFVLKNDISVHVMIQTGPNGEDPVIEDVENNTGTKLTLQKDKAVIQVQGTAERVAQAKRQLQQFVDKFVTCKVKMQPQITATLANKVSHYIRPMPWIAAAEVDESKDLLKIQGHQDSVDQTFKVMRELYRDHGLELADEDVVIKRRDEHPSHPPGGGGGGGGRSYHAAGKQCDVLRVSEDDAAFILGRGGKTKHKIARVSGAQIELHERNNTVEIYGGNDERKRARKYIDLVRAQRNGPVHVSSSHDDGDLTLISVPSSCVGFVTGTQGNFLRTCEEEWGTLMFFCDYQGPGNNLDAYGGSSEKLAIFGVLWSRCGAELKVMAAIETKLPGFYTANLGETQSWDEWGTDTFPMQSDQLSYVLGRKGSTRRKLAKASGCIIEYVGNVAFMAGYLPARRKGKEYLGWLCDQVQNKTGRISIDPTARDDVTLVPVPKDCIGYVMGDKRKTLSRLEEDWETLIFFVDARSLPASYQDDVEGLAIFGSDRGRAGTELKVMGAVETKLPMFFTRGVGDYIFDGDWGVDTLPLSGEELSFALGKDGATRRKLAKSSGCILEYVGNVAYMAGSWDERSRARDYLTWLMRQRTGPVSVDITGRTDVTEFEVPEEMRGLTKATSLREVEKESGTFCLFQGDNNTSDVLLICGHSAEARTHAEHLLQDLMVRGSVQRPKAKATRRRQGGHAQRGHQRGAPSGNQGQHAPGVRRRPPKAASSSEEGESDSDNSGSESGSQTGSEGQSGFSSRSGDDHRRRHASPAPAPPVRQPKGWGSGPRNRQWTSHDSQSESDEEIVPYW